jgi:hypothetical protein
MRSIGGWQFTNGDYTKENANMKVAKTGAFLATAVGLMFIANVALAQDNGALGGGSAPTTESAKVKCLGANSCKRQSSCKSAQNDCKGQNACKGNYSVLTCFIPVAP